MAIYQPYLQLASCNGLAKLSALAVAVRSAHLTWAAISLGIFTVGSLGYGSLVLMQTGYFHLLQ
jgi:hypothetical protein